MCPGRSARSETPQGEDERKYLIVPHEVSTGADCHGCLIIEERGDVADIVCNYCCTLIETVPIGCARQRLMELASVPHVLATARSMKISGVSVPHSKTRIRLGPEGRGRKPVDLSSEIA
jgi:hypothetical protein